LGEISKQRGQPPKDRMQSIENVEDGDTRKKSAHVRTIGEETQKRVKLRRGFVMP